MQKKFGVPGLFCGCLFAGCMPAWAAEVTSQTEVSLRQVEQYNFSIHVLAMLLVGFGFLMVFVKKHGYGATTGTYLVVGVGIPLYLLLRSSGVISAERHGAKQHPCPVAGRVRLCLGPDRNGGGTGALANLPVCRSSPRF